MYTEQFSLAIHFFQDLKLVKYKKIFTTKMNYLNNIDFLYEIIILFLLKGKTIHENTLFLYDVTTIKDLYIYYMNELYTSNSLSVQIESSV